MLSFAVGAASGGFYPHRSLIATAPIGLYARINSSHVWMNDWRRVRCGSRLSRLTKFILLR